MEPLGETTQQRFLPAYSSQIKYQVLSMSSKEWNSLKRTLNIKQSISLISVLPGPVSYTHIFWWVKNLSLYTCNLNLYNKWIASNLDLWSRWITCNLYLCTQKVRLRESGLHYCLESVLFVSIWVGLVKFNQHCLVFIHYL